MYDYKAEYVRAVDGDTVEFRVHLGFYVVTQMRFRLSGLDTPERAQVGYKEATDYVHMALSQAKEIRLLSTKTEKYGRWLASVHYVRVDGSMEILNEELVTRGLAKAYDGQGPRS